MNSGMYDKDCSTWSPQGDIPQIKYVQEAVKQGTCVVGLRSKKVAVLAAFKKRQNADFSSYDKKLFNIDDHCAIAIAGLTADARVLAEYMRVECLNHKYTYDSPMKIGRLAGQVADKAQKKTMEPGKRPFGVGILTASCDEAGAHIYENCPSGNYFEYVGMAIGARSQSAKTYLEKNFETFAELDKAEMIRHAVKAVAVTTEQDTELSTGNLDVCVVDMESGVSMLTEAELKPLIQTLKVDAPVEGDAPMEVDQ